MGYLLNGKWTDGDPAKQTGKAGTFDRIESVFRDRVTADGSSGFKAEAGAIIFMSRIRARGRIAR